jgi:hypothetical protein
VRSSLVVHALIIADRRKRKAATKMPSGALLLGVGPNPSSGYSLACEASQAGGLHGPPLA